MRWVALVVLGGCWTSAPPRPSSSVPASEPSDEPCTFTEETRGWRGLPQMVEAAAAPLSASIGPWSLDAMTPEPNAQIACEQCDVQRATRPFEVIATGGTQLALRVDGRWWAFYVMINDTCRVTYDRPVVRELLTAAPGPELFLRVTQECPQPEPFGDPEPERSEHIVLCAIGPQRLSCLQTPLGTTAFKPEYSSHTRFDLACDGTATISSWLGDNNGGFDYVRIRRPLVVP
jgi:hypothetical protein